MTPSKRIKLEIILLHEDIKKIEKDMSRIKDTWQLLIDISEAKIKLMTDNENIKSIAKIEQAKSDIEFAKKRMAFDISECNFSLITKKEELKKLNDELQNTIAKDSLVN
jgi:hypothetical protein